MQIQFMKLKLILLPLLTFFTLTNAHAEVLFLAETGFIVKNEVVVTTSRQQAWNIFINEVDRWWPSDHTWWGEEGTLTLDSYAGGCFCEKYNAKSAEHMRVTFVEPFTSMRLTGGLGPLQAMGMYGALDWTFTENEQGTLVTMTYKVNGINPQGFAQLAPIVDKVQAIQLAGLANLINLQKNN